MNDPREHHIVAYLMYPQMKKHSVRYDSEDEALKTIYIGKTALHSAFGEIPQHIEVTIMRADKE